METEEKKEKKKWDKLINIIIILIILLVSVFMYTKYIEPSSLKVKEYKIESNKIPTNFNGIKIIYFTDLLYGSTIGDNELKKIVDKINLLKPDIVIYGGNLISKTYKLKTNTKEKITKYLTSINASLGKYTTLASDKVEVEEILNESGFTILKNQKELIYNIDLEPICLIGLNSYNSGEYDLVESFKFNETESNCYLILTTHESDLIDKILTVEKTPDLILTGNTLGGEINVPFYGPLYKFKGSQKYYKDKYKKNGTLIYISNGLGTKETNLRFNNTPSISLFRLKSTH